MISALQKRPFVRPLCLWIIGIVLQSRLVYTFIIGSILLIVILLLLFSKHSPHYLTYNNKWKWGILFCALLLSLSMLTTELAERRRQHPSSPTRLETVAAETQQKLAGKIDELNLSDAEKSVLATLTLGYRQTMEREVRQKFSVTGVAHILAVSGFHVAVIGSLISLFLFFFPRNGPGKWMKYLLNLLLLWSFVYISGLAAPAVRAGIMISFYLTGRTINRQTDSYNTLAAAAFCMLAYNPFYLYDIGFQLSFTAVWFILYLRPRIYRLIRVRNPLLSHPWSWISVTLAAQAGTLFLCLYYFGQFPLVFLFTNLPLTLIANLLIPAGIIWLLLPSGLWGIGRIQSVVEFLTGALMWIVDRFSAIPGIAFHIPFSKTDLFMGYAILLLFLTYNHAKRPRTLLLALGLCLCWIVVKTSTVYA